MMKRVSAYDLLQCEEFAEADNQFALIHPDWDERVKPALWYLGMDVYDEDIPWSVQACLHTPVFDRKPVVGYTYVGKERTDKGYEKYASLDARIMRHEDMSLRQEMYAMSREGVISENGDNAIASVEVKAVPEYKQTVKEIENLQEIQMKIRGVTELSHYENVFQQ